MCLLVMSSFRSVGLENVAVEENEDTPRHKQAKKLWGDLRNSDAAKNTTLSETSRAGHDKRTSKTYTL
jgi:hypothetical protein